MIRVRAHPRHEKSGKVAQVRSHQRRTRGGGPMPKPSRMSPALKKWFGNSQVSYPNGEPIVVYHGTAGPKFRSFKKKTAYRQDESGEKEKITSQAFYFTDDKDTAKAFAYNRKKVLENLEGKKAEGRTEAFYLKAENVFDLTINADTEMKMIADGWAPYFNRSAINPYAIRELAELAGMAEEDFESWDDVQRLLDDGIVIAELKDAGYDGIKLRESNGATSYAVFDSSQIKAIDNAGTFDPDSDDIYKGVARVRAHPRRTKSGKVSQVRQFERRFREGKPEQSTPKKPGIPPALARKIRRLGADQGREVKLTTDEVKVILNSGKYALISAGRNPGDVEDKALTDAQINARHIQLREDLTAGGYAYTGVVGHYGEEEQSFLVMVHEAEKADIIKMGKKYHQESVIYGERGHQQMIYTEGESAGTYIAGEGWREIPGAQEDYYTELKTAEGKTVRFTLNFDWDVKRRLRKAIGWFYRRVA